MLMSFDDEYNKQPLYEVTNMDEDIEIRGTDESVLKTPPK